MELFVDGMMCNHCAARVKKALEAVAGVTGAEIMLMEKKAVISGDADYDALVKAVTDAGYTVITK